MRRGVMGRPPLEDDAIVVGGKSIWKMRRGYFFLAQGGSHSFKRPSHRLRLFSSHEYSRISVSISVNVRSFFYGLVYIFGSSTVMVCWM